MASTNQKSKPKSKRHLKPLKCPRCNKGFQSQGSKLTKHLQKHTGYHPLKCGYCEFLPADKEDMLKHNQDKHSGQKMKILISSSFANQKRFFEELMKKIKQNVKPPSYIAEHCSLCGEKFYSDSDYLKHLDQIHDVILEDDDDKRNQNNKHNTSISLASKSISSNSKQVEKQSTTELNNANERSKNYSGEIFKCSLCSFVCNDKFVTKMHTVEAHKDSSVEARVEISSVTTAADNPTSKTGPPEKGSDDVDLNFVEDEFSEIISSVLAYDQEIKELNLKHQKNGSSLLEHAIGDNFSIKGRKKFERPEDWLCPDCSRQNFNSLCAFLIHLRCHAHYRPYGCKQCLFSTSDRSEIKKHTDQKHPGLKPELHIIDNDVVPKAKYFNLLLGFQKMNIKTNIITIESFFICRICYSFGTFLKSQFMQHQKKCLSNKTKYGEKFDSMIHVSDKTNISEESASNKRPRENLEGKDSNKTSNSAKRTYKTCPFCQYKTISPKLLVEHILAKHPQSKTSATPESKHTCNACGLAFDDPVSLKQHKCNKNTTTLNLVECLICKKQLPSDCLQQHLQLHSKTSDIKSRSADQKVFKKFKSHKLLLLEDPNYWLNAPPLTPTKYVPLKFEVNDEPVDSTDFYVCRLCERSVPYCAKSSHLKLHHGIFKFRCKYCPYRNVSETKIHSHVKKIHKEKPEELLKMSPEDWMQTDIIIQKSIQELSDTKLNQKWQCYTCHEGFSNLEELKKHKIQRNICLAQIKRCSLCHGNFEGVPDKPCIKSKEHVLNESKFLYPPLEKCPPDSSLFAGVFVQSGIEPNDLTCDVVMKNIFD